MEQSAREFASDLVREDSFNSTRRPRIRVLSADTSRLLDAPPLLTIDVAIGEAQESEFWELTLRWDVEDVSSWEDPVFRQAMVVTVWANVMEWWDTRDNPSIVRAISKPGL